MEKLERAIRAALVNGKLPCAQAFVIAAAEKVEPIIVGREATRLSIRISRCQLGLFGYDDRGERRIVQPATDVSDELKGAICSRSVEDKIPCQAAWELASDLKLTKLQVAGAIEALGLRVSNCQLGCFA